MRSIFSRYPEGWARYYHVHQAHPAHEKLVGTQKRCPPYMAAPGGGPCECRGTARRRAPVPSRRSATLTEFTNAHVDNAGRRLYDRCVHFAERLREFAAGTMRLEPALGRLAALD